MFPRSGNSATGKGNRVNGPCLNGPYIPGVVMTKVTRPDKTTDGIESPAKALIPSGSAFGFPQGAFPGGSGPGFPTVSTASSKPPEERTFPLQFPRVPLCFLQRKPVSPSVSRGIPSVSPGFLRRKAVFPPLRPKIFQRLG